MDNNEMTQVPEETPSQKGSTHIYAYTALIFVVAILMILLAFFGQTNLKRDEHIKTEGKSITEKSADLSNENLILRDRISDLDEQLEKKDTQLNTASETNSVYERIFSVEVLIDVKNYEEAKRVLDTINAEALSGDVLTIYTKLNETIAAAVKPE